ncbi:hypothetical protein L248_1424 [Schleiferilactobacillus shenzhenensis LY-73]|uniref:Uncharacterized protein n=1 Tax=Schleiferilactobacillus shenzhenensis LY-73 TaxID=1231336 RepID=U4THF4_9LACO|nr:hypothetical protein L248_1424 [Schleiferilactobacillus shenzhenensis LY-73]
MLGGFNSGHGIGPLSHCCIKQVNRSARTRRREGAESRGWLAALASVLAKDQKRGRTGGIPSADPVLRLQMAKHNDRQRRQEQNTPQKAGEEVLPEAAKAGAAPAKDRADERYDCHDGTIPQQPIPDQQRHDHHSPFPTETVAANKRYCVIPFLP